MVNAGRLETKMEGSSKSPRHLALGAAERGAGIVTRVPVSTAAVS